MSVYSPRGRHPRGIAGGRANAKDRRRAIVVASAPDPGEDMPTGYDEPDYDEDDGGFECAKYWDGTSWHCPLAGSEECDWECNE